jgi:hypothetical protein
MDNSTISIYKAVNGYWYGKIIKSDNNTFIGKLLFSKLEYNEKSASFEGLITKPSNHIDANAILTLTNNTSVKVANSKLAIIPGGHGQYIGEVTTITTDFKENDLVVPMIEKFLDKKEK